MGAIRKVVDQALAAKDEHDSKVEAMEAQAQKAEDTGDYSESRKWMAEVRKAQKEFEATMLKGIASEADDLMEKLMALTLRQVEAMERIAAELKSLSQK